MQIRYSLLYCYMLTDGRTTRTQCVIRMDVADAPEAGSKAVYLFQLVHEIHLTISI